MNSLDFCPYDYDPDKLVHYAYVILSADGYLVGPVCGRWMVLKVDA